MPHRPQKKPTEIYKLNQRLATALRLPQKEELDRKDNFYTFAGRTERWDDRSVHLRYVNKTPLREVDFTKRIDLLITYAMCYKFSIINNLDGHYVEVKLEEGHDVVRFERDTLSMTLIDALIFYCEKKNFEHPQFLVHDYMELL
ncbi:hypothetical protein [Vibrio crassostreae]|uniref:hypothetical protein n=1 Tax=Vibrio crassostreae TaxID=246167 RepID=UPI001B3144FA|nr:hypothetical protein [Vibrio crassostreae]